MPLHLIFEALVELSKVKIHLNIKNVCQTKILQFRGSLKIVEISKSEVTKEVIIVVAVLYYCRICKFRLQVSNV